MGKDLALEFGRYRLVERLAVGGMAELYRATIEGAHDFEKPVVIKRILPHLAADEDFVSMFIDEAKLTAQLMHPKIVQVFELGRRDGQLFIAMEYVDGIDALDLLRSHAERNRKIPPEIAAYVMHEVTDALDFAHTATSDDGAPLGIIHRDVSPGNILLSRRGSVKLTDFGIAIVASHRAHSEEETIKGKYGYMSPEQIVGADIDGRSDLFACGVVLAEMLMGKRLFSGKSDAEVLAMVRDVELDRYHAARGEIHRELRWIIERALRRDPKNRFPDARSFREALADWLFRQRLRVGPDDLARVVEEILPEKRQDARAPTPAGEEKEWSLATFFERASSESEESEDYAVETMELSRPAEEGGLRPEDLDAMDLPSSPCAPDEEGDLSEISPIRVLYRLAAAGATGRLVLEHGWMKKSAYLVGGFPRHVETNVESERFGRRVVDRGDIAEGELSMALAVQSQFESRLADTLVRLELLEADRAAEAVVDCLRDRLVDACTWGAGTFRWLRGIEAPEPEDEISVDPYAVLGAGAMAVGEEAIERWAQERLELAPRALAGGALDLSSFGLGRRPQEIHRILDGARSLGELRALFPTRGIWLDALRILFLLKETDFLALEPKGPRPG